MDQGPTWLSAMPGPSAKRFPARSLTHSRGRSAALAQQQRLRAGVCPRSSRDAASFLALPRGCSLSSAAALGPGGTRPHPWPLRGQAHPERPPVPRLDPLGARKAHSHQGSLTRAGGDGSPGPTSEGPFSSPLQSSQGPGADHPDLAESAQDGPHSSPSSIPCTAPVASGPEAAPTRWQLPTLVPAHSAPALALVLLGGAAAHLLGLVSPQPALASGAVEGGGTSIATSSVGIKVASWLRSAAGGAVPDSAIVMLVAALPVVELRGAIPVAYWMGMTPLKASLLSVLGNMIPVPFILLLLGPLSEALTSWNARAKKGLDWVLEYTRKKADPIVEFQALGLMLFVAVPLPGTGAWSGAIAAYILKLPFWEAFWANFFGVVLAGAIVTALCVLGLREAVALAAGLFVLSGVMWSALRVLLPRRAT